jgi:hypothetical protein
MEGTMATQWTRYAAGIAAVGLHMIFMGTNRLVYENALLAHTVLVAVE